MDKLQTAVEALLSELDAFIPTPNCSCHINPPCSDCVEYTCLRAAVAEVKAALDTSKKGLQ